MAQKLEPESGTMEKVAEKLSEVILVIIPLCIGYFAGTMYLSAYLSTYSISIHEIDVSTHLIITYSFDVFSNSLFVFFAVLGIVILIAAQTFFAKWTRLLVVMILTVRINAIVAALTAIVAMFFIIYLCAGVAASRSASRVWDGRTSRVLFMALPQPSDVSLGVRQKIRYNDCIDRNDFREIISTSTVTYGLCVTGENEGLVFGQRHEDGKLLPVRDIRYEKRSGDYCLLGICIPSLFD